MPILDHSGVAKRPNPARTWKMIRRDGERYKNRDISFEGTVVHITLRCDESLYRFRNEIASPF
jgi:hypothetical protein